MKRQKKLYDELASTWQRANENIKTLEDQIEKN